MKLAHYIPAKIYGFKPKLHYGSVSFGSYPDGETMRAYYDKHKAKINSSENSPEKENFNNWEEKNHFKQFIITLCGPLQTIITGTIGFLVLWFNRNKIRMHGVLSLKDWVMVLLCFFWSRQLANVLLWTIRYATTGEIRYTGDEIQLAMYLFSLKPGNLLLAAGSISYATAIAALAIILCTIFYIIPSRQRYTFFVAGLLGSALGWTIWMRTLGPVLMP
jgi:hypothetical protein